MKHKKIQIEALIRAVYKHWKKGLPKPSDPCPSEEVMACFMDSLLSKKEEDAVKKHLILCDKCMEELLTTLRVKNTQC